MWRVVLRSHQQHPLRLVLVCVAISLGVAFLAGTFILTDTEQAGISSTANSAYEHVSAAVLGPRSSSGQEGLTGFAPVPSRVLGEVRSANGVAQATGEVLGYAQLLGRNGELVGGQSESTEGVSVSSVAALRPFVVDRGHLPTAANQIVVDAHTFAGQGLRLGQSVRVVTNSPTARFTVVGVIASRDSSDVLGYTLIGFSVAEAQHLMGTPGGYSAILATARPGVSDAVLAAALIRAVAPGYLVPTGAEFRSFVSDASSQGAPKFSVVLNVVLGIALFVGALVIFNIINLLVSQRRKELAMLRCLGASRAQIYRSVLGEAAALGVVASGVGLLIGIGAAALLRGESGGAAAQTSSAPLVIGSWTVIISLVVGTAVTCVASLLPAMAASRITPISALRRDAMDDATASAGGWKSSGLSMAGSGLALVLIGLFINQGDRVELGLVGVGMAVCLIGLARLSPLLIPPLIAVMGWPLHHLSGVSGVLGRQNATRNARRTAVTAAALIIGVTLVSVLAIIDTSQSASTNQVVGKALTADFEVVHNGALPFTYGPRDSLPVSPAILHRLQSSSASSKVAVSPFAFVTFSLHGRGNFGAAIDPSTIADMNSFGSVQGDLAALAHGGMAVSTQQAAVSDVHVGEEVPIVFDNQRDTGQSTTMRVVAIYPQGDLALSGYLFSTATADRIDPSLLLNAVLVKARPGVPVSAARQAVERAVAGYSDVVVQDEAQVQSTLDRSDSTEYNLISVLLVLAIAVALLGIVNTLALSVVERTRELAMLRAVGMARSQMRSMIRAEAALIGMVGSLAGVVLGVFLGWVFQRALVSQGITELVVPWGRLVLYAVAGAVTGYIAGTIPARRAAKVDMLAAIAAE
jgi:putative ABC transport system permease protein